MTLTSSTLNCLFVSQGHLDFPFLGIKQYFWAIKSAVVWQCRSDLSVVQVAEGRKLGI